MFLILVNSILICLSVPLYFAGSGIFQCICLVESTIGHFLLASSHNVITKSKLVNLLISIFFDLWSDIFIPISNNMLPHYSNWWLIWRTIEYMCFVMQNIEMVQTENFAQHQTTIFLWKVHNISSWEARANSLLLNSIQKVQLPKQSCS